MHILENKRKINRIAILTAIVIVQFIIAFYFCAQKEGFHYDEYYSYYSSNVTYGLVPTDREWKDIEGITSEFIVAEDGKFQYEMVTLMQSYDVHPPLYYWLLHTVCSIFYGTFSKWTGLGINLGCFVVAYYLFAYICSKIYKENFYLTALTCGLFGSCVGVLSGITFIRMYMLLLVWCLGTMCIHMNVLFRKNDSIKKRIVTCYLPVYLFSFLGFMTHYYFLIFMFFLAASSCIGLLLQDKNLKECIKYGMSVVLGIISAIAVYPSSLSHMFRGYRGNEATDAFFTLENTGERLAFFGGLVNEFVFSGLLYGILGVCAILSVTTIYVFRNRDNKKEKIMKKITSHKEIVILFVTTVGYFFAVAKTALLNAEEATRYELPIFGFTLILVIGFMYCLCENLVVWWMEKRKSSIGKERSKLVKKAPMIIVVLLSLSMFASCLSLLYNHQVQFLYEEDRESIEWAKEHSDDCVVYLYNATNIWMIWDESEELMQYEEIYFVSMEDTSPIIDEKIENTTKVYVYASRSDVVETMLDDMVANNKNISSYHLERQLLYCDLYVLQ